jgi:hypothetical protein
VIFDYLLVGTKSGVIRLESTLCQIIHSVNAVKSKTDWNFITVPHAVKTKLVFLVRVIASRLRKRL